MFDSFDASPPSSTHQQLGSMITARRSNFYFGDDRNFGTFHIGIGASSSATAVPRNQLFDFWQHVHDWTGSLLSLDRDGWAGRRMLIGKRTLAPAAQRQTYALIGSVTRQGSLPAFRNTNAARVHLQAQATVAKRLHFLALVLRLHRLRRRHLFPDNKKTTKTLAWFDSQHGFLWRWLGLLRVSLLHFIRTTRVSRRMQSVERRCGVVM